MWGTTSNRFGSCSRLTAARSREYVRRDDRKELRLHGPYFARKPKMRHLDGMGARASLELRGKRTSNALQQCCLAVSKRFTYVTFTHQATVPKLHPRSRWAHSNHSQILSTSAVTRVQGQIHNTPDAHEASLGRLTKRKAHQSHAEATRTVPRC